MKELKLRTHITIHKKTAIFYLLRLPLEAKLGIQVHHESDLDIAQLFLEAPRRVAHTYITDSCCYK
jgi:hypothetical protein